MPYKKARELRDIVLDSMSGLASELSDGGVLNKEYIDGLVAKVRQKVNKSYDQLFKGLVPAEKESEKHECRKLYILQYWGGQGHDYNCFLTHILPITEDEFCRFIEEGQIALYADAGREQSYQDLTTWLVKHRGFRALDDDELDQLPWPVSEVIMLLPDNM